LSKICAICNAIDLVSANEMSAVTATPTSAPVHFGSGAKPRHGRHVLRVRVQGSRRDLAHPAFTQLGDDFIRTEASAGGRGHESTRLACGYLMKLFGGVTPSQIRPPALTPQISVKYVPVGLTPHASRLHQLLHRADERVDLAERRVDVRRDANAAVVILLTWRLRP